MKLTLRFIASVGITVLLAACSPPQMDIVIDRLGDKVDIVRPWSVWNIVGLGRRDYCIRRIELFDAKTLIWVLEYKNGQCLRVAMPVTLGKQIVGFESKGSPNLKSGVVYGIGISGIGYGRMDFTFNRDGSVKNVTDWRRLIDGPCGSIFGKCSTATS